MASLDEQYPHIAQWVDGWGWIEIGEDDGPLGVIRVLDIGGLLWDSGVRLTRHLMTSFRNWNVS